MCSPVKVNTKTTFVSSFRIQILPSFICHCSWVGVTVNDVPVINGGRFTYFCFFSGISLFMLKIRLDVRSHRKLEKNIEVNLTTNPAVANQTNINF